MAKQLDGLSFTLCFFIIQVNCKGLVQGEFSSQWEFWFKQTQNPLYLAFARIECKSAKS